MHKGQHLLVDCREVPRQLCVNDQLLLDTLAEATRNNGATVISQMRYQFGADSPPGCTAIVMLDESHCSVHTYADAGLVAFDFFTCGDTSPVAIWEEVRDKLGIKNATLRNVSRFDSALPDVPLAAAEAASRSLR